LRPIRWGTLKYEPKASFDSKLGTRNSKLVTVMPEEKKTPVEEAKWWIDRGPVKEREKREKTQLGQGLIEQWVYGLLKDYKQEQAVRNVVDMNQKLLQSFPAEPREWGYLSLGVGSYPAAGLARIKEALQLPPYARALVIDAGYSVRVLITGEPIGERLIDVNFTEGPSLDYWVGGEMVEESLFPTVEQALRRLRGSLHAYLNPPMD